MARKAILLVEAVSGKAAEVCHYLTKSEGVRSAYLVTPPYDIMAVLEAESSKDIDDRVGFLKQHVDGVIRVVVCFALDFEATQLATFVDRNAVERPAGPLLTFVR